MIEILLSKWREKKQKEQSFRDLGDYNLLGFCFQVYQDRKKQRGLKKYLREKWLKTPDLVSEYERNPKEDKAKDNPCQTL